MKISNRLKTICDFIPDNSRVLDIGCDHALLDIYLTINKNCDCIASDINTNVLELSKSNVQKYNLEDKIKIIKSNGINNIEDFENRYVVIAGMGTNLILSIIDNIKFSKINDLIIQTNNDLDLFRKKIYKYNFCIEDEQIVYENKKYYVIFKLKKGKIKYNYYECLLGPILLRKNCEIRKKYYKYLYMKYNNIYNNLPNKKILKKYKLFKIKKKLNKYI